MRSFVTAETIRAELRTELESWLPDAPIVDVSLAWLFDDMGDDTTDCGLVSVP